MGPKNPRSSLLSLNDEAIILAYRWRTRLALDDAHSRLRRLMPKLTRSTLHRCLKRYGLSRIGPTAICPPLTTTALTGPYIFEITAHEVHFCDPDDVIGVGFPVLIAVEEITKDVYAEVAGPTPENAAAFRVRLVAELPEKIIAVTTEDASSVHGPAFGTLDEDMAAVSGHPFAVACRAHGIAHTQSIPAHTKPPEIGSPRRRNPVVARSARSVRRITLVRCRRWLLSQKRRGDILLSRHGHSNGKISVQNLSLMQSIDGKGGPSGGRGGAQSLCCARFTARKFNALA